MITKFVDEWGRKVFAKTQEDLLSSDLTPDKLIMVNRIFYKIIDSHIEFVENSSPIRMVIIEEV